MKKFLAILMALTLAMSMSISAYATEDGGSGTGTEEGGGTGTEEGGTGDAEGGTNAPTSNYPVDKDARATDNSIEIKKDYIIDGVTTVNPADTLHFVLNSKDYTNPGGSVLAEIPEITFANDGDVVVAEGAENVTLTVNFPAYEQPGIYTYQFSETDKNIAGVEYTYTNGTYLQLKITVVNDVNDEGKIQYESDGVTPKLIIAGIALREGDASGTKTTKLDGPIAGDEDVYNNYKAGSLTVSKTVSGNLADFNQIWNFTVVFKAPEGDTVNADITFSKNTATSTAIEDTDVTKIAKGWTGTKTLDLQLKHGESITFENIPNGVTYTVTEATDEHYTTTPAGGTATDTVTTTAKTAAFNNDYSDIPDTGFVLDSVPYMMLLMMAMAGVAMMLVRRREEF